MPDIEKLKDVIGQIEACEPQGKAWKDMTPKEQAEAKRQEEEDIKLYEAERKSKLEKKNSNAICLLCFVLLCGCY